MKRFKMQTKAPILQCWTHNGIPRSKKNKLSNFIVDREQLMPYLGYERKQWNQDEKHLKQPFPPLRQTHFRQILTNAPEAARAKGQPYYLTFVNQARLWDRGVHHYLPNHEAHATMPSFPCPRFIAHMNALPGALESPEVSSPQDLPQKPLKDHCRELLTAPKNIWKTTVYPSTQDIAQAFSLVPGHGTKTISKSPAPRKASSDEELEKDKGKTESAASQAKNNAAQEECGKHKVFLNDAVPGSRELAELDKIRESVTPILPESNEHLSDFYKNASSVLSQNTDCSFDRVTNRSAGLWKRASSASGSASGCSTDLSQLRCSSFSLDSVACSDSELEPDNSGKISNRNQLHNDSPLVASSLYSSIVNDNPSLSGCHSISDPLQASPSAEKLSPPKEPPSFLEIWHDQVLNHWSVLPPISPQRASTDALCEESYGDLTAYKELDGIIPPPGFLSHRRSDKSSNLSDSEIPPQHSALVSANTPIVTYLNNESEEPQSFVRMDTDLNPSLLLVKDIKQNSTDPASSMLQSVLTKDSGQFSASSPSCVNEEDSPSHTNNANESEPGWASEDVQLMKRTWSQDGSDGGVDIGLQLSKDTEENEAISSVSSCQAESEKILESPQTSQIDRHEPSEVEYSLSEETGRARQAEERKTIALTMLKKLRASKAPCVGGKEAMNISNFEDFDFLAKYCIFNQEKLALYKRTFEAVDSDRDGYLTCLEVLTALKEIVPAGELTDAEEIYIYRILEITDYRVTDGLTDLRLFAVIASLAQKIAALDAITVITQTPLFGSPRMLFFYAPVPRLMQLIDKIGCKDLVAVLDELNDFMRSLIGNMDFKTLELKMYKARQLFLCNVDSDKSSISVQQLLVELKAGGISEIHEESVKKKLLNTKALDLLDFLTYLPLFVLIHNTILLNPLDNSRTI